MRKENSTFNMSFISQPGAQTLHNNDYFGCSELENFACYVVADGIRSGNEKSEDPSARIAVEAVISAFNDKPSIKKAAVENYLKIAHRAMRQNEQRGRRRCSITVVVTNYENLRYAWAGNCRFNLYRGGKLISESSDHSLSWQMMEDELIPRDKIARHEERGNLVSYCGTMRKFEAGVSKRVKLKNADVFSLFTRGVWEGASTDDILKSIQAGDNDPLEALRHIERLILDKIPAEGQSENYTVCLVFVDKVFIDPERAKRRKRIIIISIIAFVLIVIIVVAIILYTNWRGRQREDMHTAFLNGIAYIQSLNFIRSREELGRAYDLAVRLRDGQNRESITNHMMLAEAIIFADDLLISGNYSQAIDAFGGAVNRSRFADNLAIGYIESRRDMAQQHISVHEYIFLGDTFAEIGDFDNAQALYLNARSLAARIHYGQGRQLANQAIESLRQLREQQLEEEEEAMQAHMGAVQSQLEAAQFVVEGDNAMRDGDTVGAMLFYLMARDRFEEMGDFSAVDMVERRMELIELMGVQNEHMLEFAAEYISAGDEMLAHGHYADARGFYLLARGIFAELGDEEGLAQVADRLEILDFYMLGVRG